MYHITCNIESHVYARKGFGRLKIKEACQKDPQFQPGIITGGSLYGIFEGRKYNCVVRLHNIIYGALLKQHGKDSIPGWNSYILLSYKNSDRYQSKLHSNIIQDQQNELMGQESSVRI